MRDRYLTTTAAGELLGVSDDTIRRYIAERRLEAIAITATTRITFRIRESDLERFRAAHVRNTLRDDWER